MKIHTYIFLIAVSIAFSFSACTPERRVANKFIKTENTIPVLIIEPDYLFKTNHKTQYTLKNWDNLSKRKKDSLEISTSKFLKDLDSKTILVNFNKQLFQTLEKYPHLELYNSSQMDEFLQKGTNGYIFNFNQVQVEEYISLYRDSTYYNGRKYIQEFDRDAITVNFWVEITATNKPDSKMKVAFTSVHTFDKISGYFSFDLFTGKVNYNYTLDELRLHKIYDMLNYAARKNGRLIFNYILNNYISEKLVPKPNQETFFHYNPKNKKLIRVNNPKYKFHFLEK